MIQVKAGRLLAYLLRPIARFCLTHGLRIQDVEVTFKSVLAEEAKRFLVVHSEPVSASRLSVITGIARKLLPKLGEDYAEDLGLIAKIINAWSGAGNARLSVVGDKSEFARLVSSVSKDLNPYSILKELERLELVSRDGDFIVPRHSVAITKDAEKVYATVSEDIDSLLNAVHNNVRSEPDGCHLQLSTFYDAIPDEAVEELQAWVLVAGSKFHEQVRNHVARWDKDNNPELSHLPGKNVIRVCAHSYIARVRGGPRK